MKVYRYGHTLFMKTKRNKYFIQYSKNAMHEEVKQEAFGYDIRSGLWFRIGKKKVSN